MSKPATQTRARSRPLSPHLTVYRWPITMTMSILHRISGGALYVGTLLVAWWLIALATSVYFIPRYSLAGGIGTLSTRPAPVNGLQIVDDGLEFAGQQCVGSMCVSGGISP